MAKSLKTRINDLENDNPERSPVIAWQSLDDPDLYRVRETGKATGRYSESREPWEVMTLNEIETKYPGHMMIKVVYKEMANP